MRIIKTFSISCIALIAGYFIFFAPSSATQISVMTFNIENGGTQIDFNKVVEAIKSANADVVGIQEAWGHTALLGQKLGWKYYNNRQHIVSRYPLLESTDSHNLYTLIEVKPGYVVAMANIHLPDESYGPELLQTGTTAKKIEAIEKKVRLPSALPYIQKLSFLATQGVPVFLTGDFNSPSHLDWSASSQQALKHHTAVVNWPVTQAAEEYGLIDAYRQLYPNTHEDIVTTWPAHRPVAKHSFDGFNPSSKELADRLDFIYTDKNTKTLSANIVAESTYPLAQIHVDPWPSDHRAVVARFKIHPAELSLFEIQNPLLKNGSYHPSITVNKHQLKPGEPFTIHWQTDAGHRYDYIMIHPTGSNKTAWGEAVRLYTNGYMEGAIIYNGQTVKGNWLAWHTGQEGKWPMAPGSYLVRLMLDDSFTELARTQVIVK